MKTLSKNISMVSYQEWFLLSYTTDYYLRNPGNFYMIMFPVLTGS